MPIHPPPLHNSNVHFTDNWEYGDVPELNDKIDRIVVMAQNKALIVEQLILKERPVDTAMNKQQGLNYWNLQGISDIVMASIADSHTYQKSLHDSSFQRVW